MTETRAEPQIEGVPEGWRLITIRMGRRGEWYLGSAGTPHELLIDSDRIAPIVERIKPKKRVLVAEFDLDENTVEPLYVIYAHSLDRALAPNRRRVEERDA